MFKKKAHSPSATVSVVLDNQTVSLPRDLSVAAGLLEQGELVSRISPASGDARAPHCLMGICCECMMEIDGVKRRACMTRPESGMVIRRGLTDPDSHAQTEEENHGPSL